MSEDVIKIKKESTQGTAFQPPVWKSSVFIERVPDDPRDLEFTHENSVYYFKLRGSDRSVCPIILNDELTLRVKDEKTKRVRTVRAYKTLSLVEKAGE